MEIGLGDRVKRKQRLAVIGNAAGATERVLRAREEGIVIGLLQTAVVHRGDPVVHMAKLRPRTRPRAPKESSSS